MSPSRDFEIAIPEFQGSCDLGQNHSREVERERRSPALLTRAHGTGWDGRSNLLLILIFARCLATKSFPWARPPVPDPQVAPGRPLPRVVPLGGRPLRALVIQARMLQPVENSSCVVRGRGPGTQDTVQTGGSGGNHPRTPAVSASHFRALRAGTRGRTGSRIRIPIRLGTPSPSSPDLQGWIGGRNPTRIRILSRPGECPVRAQQLGRTTDPLHIPGTRWSPGPLAWGPERRRASGSASSGAPPLFGIWRKVNPVLGTPERVGRRHFRGEWGRVGSRRPGPSGIQSYRSIHL